jgi:hypothetical protein
MRLYTLLLWLLVVLTSSCSILKRKYFVFLDADDLRKNHGFPAHTQVETLHIDSSYQLYVRSICRPTKPAQRFYTGGSPNAAAAVGRCDCAELAVPLAGEQLEIQYLLLSRQQGKLIYITGLPPYLVNGESHFDRPLSRLEEFANLQEMNTFFFGELQPGSSPSAFRVILWHKAAKISPLGATLGQEEWLFTVDPSGEWLTLDRVEQQQVGSIVASQPAAVFPRPLRFHRPNTPWTLGLSQEFTASSLGTAHISELMPREFYIVHDGDEIEQVAFRFQQPFQPRGSSQQMVGLYFRGNRVKAHPLFQPPATKSRPLEPEL